MKRVGITGPPGGGKTSLWRAVTGGSSSGDTGTVAVPDSRLDVLTELHSSRKRVPVQIEVVDVHASARTAGLAFGKLREVDATVLVIPEFGGQDGGAALREGLDELIFADMGPIETRLRRAKKDPDAKNEVAPLEAAMAVLEDGRTLRGHPWDSLHLQAFSPMGLITLKPLFVVWNVDEKNLEVPRTNDHPPSLVASLSLEAEVAGMETGESQALLAAYGISQPLAGRLIGEIYSTFDLITFYTASDKESRAWEISRGTPASRAAGTIHSDIERGFIRVEVASLDDVIEAGSYDAVRSKGKIRLEGRDYEMADGDVVYFRFAV